MLLSCVVFRLETGTAATVFFTGKTDLSLVVLVRRVLAFPYGWLLGREIDINLLVSLGGRLRLAIPVRRGEDAKRHGDAGFKVQVGDLNGARILFPTTFRTTKGRSRRFLLLFFLKYLKEKKGDEEAAVDTLTSRLDSFWQM